MGIEDGGDSPAVEGRQETGEGDLADLYLAAYAQTFLCIEALMPGLTPAEAKVLTYLGRIQNPLTHTAISSQRDIEDAMKVDRKHVKGAIRRLCTQKLIEAGEQRGRLQTVYHLHFLKVISLTSWAENKFRAGGGIENLQGEVSDIPCGGLRPPQAATAGGSGGESGGESGGLRPPQAATAGGSGGESGGESGGLRPPQAATAGGSGGESGGESGGLRPPQAAFSPVQTPFPGMASGVSSRTQDIRARADRSIDDLGFYKDLLSIDESGGLKPPVAEAMDRTLLARPDQFSPTQLGAIRPYATKWLRLQQAHSKAEPPDDITLAQLLTAAGSERAAIEFIEHKDRMKNLGAGNCQYLVSAMLQKLHQIPPMVTRARRTELRLLKGNKPTPEPKAEPTSTEKQIQEPPWRLKRHGE